jgi:hypothetical protein
MCQRQARVRGVARALSWRHFPDGAVSIDDCSTIATSYIGRLSRSNYAPPHLSPHISQNTTLNSNHASPNTPLPPPPNAPLHPPTHNCRPPFNTHLHIHPAPSSPPNHHHRCRVQIGHTQNTEPADTRHEGAQFGQEDVRRVQEREEEEGKVCVYYLRQESEA